MQKGFVKIRSSVRQLYLLCKIMRFYVKELTLLDPAGSLGLNNPWEGGLTTLDNREVI